MTADLSLPRERLDGTIGWWRKGEQQVSQVGLWADGARLHLVETLTDADGETMFAQPIPDTEPAGSFGGRTLPRGVAVSAQGDVYLADPTGGRILYTRASLPPEAKTGDPAAPFVPLYQFASDSGDHVLRLEQPVDLALIPAGAATFGDCLVVADDAGSRLVWIDRCQIVARHVLELAAAPVAMGVDGQGRIRVVTAAQELLTIVGGKVQRSDALAFQPHSVYITPAGVALLSDDKSLWAIDLAGRDDLDVAAILDAGPFAPPSFQYTDGKLVMAGRCDDGEPLQVGPVDLDRYGALGGTGLALVTLMQRLARPRQGTWIVGPFDGAARGFAWDRIGLDALIPEQCSLMISTYVTDFEMDMAQVQLADGWSGRVPIGPNDVPESLVQRNRGQFLWLRLVALGNGKTSAEVTGIDIFGPRQSQLNLLPLPFQQDAESADFLDRFLSLQDRFFDEAMGAFQNMGAILRSDATPEEFIGWLGGWFDWEFLPEWSIEIRREMIAASMVFFGQRGTVQGLQRMLQWHTGLRDGLPAVIEDFRLTGTEWVGGQPVDPSAPRAHAFRVIMPLDAAKDDLARTQIMRIIDAQKPAHATCQLVLIRPEFMPGRQGILGVDAILPDSRPPPLGAGALGAGLQTVGQC